MPSQVKSSQVKPNTAPPLHRSTHTPSYPPDGSLPHETLAKEVHIGWQVGSGVPGTDMEKLEQLVDLGRVICRQTKRERERDRKRERNKEKEREK